MFKGPNEINCIDLQIMLEKQAMACENVYVMYKTPASYIKHYEEAWWSDVERHPVFICK